MSILILINSCVFFLLSLLHVYWAIGGKWGINVAVPVQKDGQNVFQPGRIATLIVAVGLFLFSIIVAGNLGLWNSQIDSRLITVGTFIIGGVFLIRVIGDFKYVGITKHVKNTRFAESDNRIFIPLCLFVSLSCIIIGIWV
ncbi:DUF3995 domain-containing protein [Pedobacter sp. ASV1-7]|uniref:DUF3995 domain-containing protein n=1 Tax=Pedobacter sp. ASV1-7 TaxID=3145237 RepID=UPI0032E92309